MTSTIDMASAASRHRDAGPTGPAPSWGPHWIYVLGTRLAPVSRRDAAEFMFQMVDEGRRGWIATVNVSILCDLRRSTEMAGFVARSALTVADGQPLVWVSAALRSLLPGRVTGVDLIDDICAGAESRGIGVYILGGTAETSVLATAELRRRYPALILHADDGYFSGEEATRRAEHIAASGARILIVGMGVPRQEQFISQHWADLGVATAIGVGGSLDVISGRLRRAPLWMQRAGLEWAYRLKQEPRRLWRRYVCTNSEFLLCLALDALAGKAQRTTRVGPTFSISDALDALPREKASSPQQDSHRKGEQLTVPQGRQSCDLIETIGSSDAVTAPGL